MADFDDYIVDDYLASHLLAWLVKQANKLLLEESKSGTGLKQKLMLENLSEAQSYLNNAAQVKFGGSKSAKNPLAPHLYDPSMPNVQAARTIGQWIAPPSAIGGIIDVFDTAPLVVKINCPSCNHEVQVPAKESDSFDLPCGCRFRQAASVSKINSRIKAKLAK